VLSWEYHCPAYLAADTHSTPYYVQVKSLTRTLDQLQRHGAQLGVPLPGLPGSGTSLKEVYR
jgi:hypothetical protein